MKVEILELEDQYAKLVIDGVRPHFVNALRRVLLTEVPKLSIDTVTFYDNTSALFDEILAHRLGLVPIPTDPATLNLTGAVDDEGKPTYLVRFTLTKEGPCTVYSGDLECDDPYFTIRDDRIPLVELTAGQRLILEAEAILGVGTTHAKWQACHAVGYKYFPTVTIDNDKVDAERLAFALGLTPPGIVAEENGQIVVLDEMEVNKATELQVQMPDAFKINHDDRRFIFKFETDGALKAEDALMKALELLKERFKEFGRQAVELKAA